MKNRIKRNGRETAGIEEGIWGDKTKNSGMVEKKEGQPFLPLTVGKTNHKLGGRSGCEGKEKKVHQKKEPAQPVRRKVKHGTHWGRKLTIRMETKKPLIRGTGRETEKPGAKLKQSQKRRHQDAFKAASIKD